MAQIIDYPWATLRRSLYCRYTLLDEICFAVLSPAFLSPALCGDTLTKGFGGQTHAIKVICHLFLVFRLSCAPPQTKVNLLHGELAPPSPATQKKPSFSPK